LAAVPGGWLSERIGYRNTTVFGLVMAIVGFVLIRLTWTITISDPAIVGQMMLIGVGIGLTFSPISTIVINSTRDDQRGVASALVIVLRLIGMTISVSSLTTFALQRVNFLVAAQFGVAGVDPIQYADTYARITVEVLGELGLVGAGVAILGLLPALLIYNRLPAAGDTPENQDKISQNGYAGEEKLAYTEEIRK
ncbi:MAG: hypothetical protein H7X77_01410, partial [Anaerolineae bacterium]|nr:hypothetical protein [Anaerolineae bacterium]